MTAEVEFKKDIAEVTVELFKTGHCRCASFDFGVCSKSVGKKSFFVIYLGIRRFWSIASFFFLFFSSSCWGLK